MNVRYPEPKGKLSDAELATVTAMVRDKIVSKVDRLRPAEWLAGDKWYPAANRHCRAIGRQFGIDPVQVAYALAVLSPMNGWSQNKDDLESVITKGSAGTFDASVDKAIDILENGHKGSDVAGGRKVRSFAANIAYPYNSDDVTLDTHMLAILGIDTGYLARKGIYDAVSEAFRQVATVHGVRVNSLQASLWIQQRGNAE